MGLELVVPLVQNEVGELARVLAGDEGVLLVGPLLPIAVEAAVVALR